jgi:hypothetical protein
MGRFNTDLWSSFLGVKIVHLLDRTKLCKISNLDYGDNKIVTYCIAAYRERDSLLRL